MMQPKDMLKQMIDFNKTAYENVFKNMNILHEQMEKSINLYIDQAPGMSEEGKKAAKEWASMYKKGYEDFKNLVDDNIKKMEAFFQ
jgi:archaellum component FlaC